MSTAPVINFNFADPNSIIGQNITQVEVCLNCAARKAYLKGSSTPVILPPTWNLPPVQVDAIVPLWCPACDDISRFLFF